MALGWILTGALVWVVGMFVVLALFRMSGEQDRAARRQEKRMNPESDVTITRMGDG